MKNILLITVPASIILFLLIENIFHAQPKKPRLLELTGKMETTNTLLNWAENEPYFAYSPRSDIDSLSGKYINNHDFISTPDISLEKEENIIRIAFLGESSTAGTGKNLVDEATWPWKVNETLQQKGYKTDFINAACGGFTTFDSYGILWSKVRFFNPDIIVVNHGWNDFGYFHLDEEEMLNFRKNQKGKYEGVKFKGYFETYKPLFIDSFIYWSQILSRLRLLIFSKEGRGELIFEEEFEDILGKELLGVETFEENLFLIQTFCEAFNIACFYCKQPTLVTNKNIDFSENQEQYRVEFVQQRQEDFDKIYQVVGNLFPDNQIIDLREISGNEAYFWDHIHPSPEGTDAIAAIVADSLINQFFSKVKY